MFKATYFLFFISFSITIGFAQTSKQNLDKGWTFHQARLANSYPAKVPGVVQTDLLANGIIEDPFFKLNERAVQWIDKEDWIYENTFDINPDVFQKNNKILTFKGLDTYADVYLNDSLVLKANNMFREWTVNVSELLKDKNNHLKIYFRSPIKEDLPKFDALPFQYFAVNDQSENGGMFDKKVSIFARKAGYQYGWDWGPRLVTSGIWRPVFIESWNDAKFNDIFVDQKTVTKKEANIITHFEIESEREINNAEVLISDGKTNKKYNSVKTNLKKGINMVSVSMTIKNPELWWSNGLGKPNLYQFNCQLSENGKVLDNQKKKVGIRSLKVISKPDKDGQSFYFELNGVPVFAKGANYIPSDSFLPRITPNIYKREVKAAVDANMNMLRVWGGGIYEDDLFYDLCDENGILVWQDFMFACSMYPADKDFLENVRQEAIYNVKRLRNHPSIAIWVGNNEISEAWFYWGWKDQMEKKDPQSAKLMWKQYEDLFYKLLPSIISEYSPDATYRPSSPFSRKENGSEPNKGDSHYWSVWHGKEPISKYNEYKSRFFSEYGFQSFPEFETVKSYAPDSKDWNITSEVMMSHQRGGSFANSLIKDYLDKNYKEGKDFPQFLLANQILQGDAIKTAIEAHRRNRPYTMGTLFWQINDCWPVASWSSRDYYGRWKAQQYYARKAYKDLLFSPVADNQNVKIYAVSDRLADTKGKLTISVMTLDGAVIYNETSTVAVKANTSAEMVNFSKQKLLKNSKETDAILYVLYEDKSGERYDNIYLFVPPKDLQLNPLKITPEIKQVSGGFEVSVQAPSYVKAVHFSLPQTDVVFEDNYFDILPKTKRNIKITTSLSKEEFIKQLKVESLNETY